MKIKKKSLINGLTGSALLIIVSFILITGIELEKESYYEIRNINIIIKSINELKMITLNGILNPDSINQNYWERKWEELNDNLLMEKNKSRNRKYINLLIEKHFEAKNLYSELVNNIKPHQDSIISNDKNKSSVNLIINNFLSEYQQIIDITSHRYDDIQKNIIIISNFNIVFIISISAFLFLLILVSAFWKIFTLSDENLDFSIKRDVFGQNLVKTSLLESENKYRQFFEKAQEGICFINNNGLIQYANSKMADLLGYVIDDLISQPFNKFVDQSSQEKSKNIFSCNIEEITDTIEIKLKKKDGSEIYTIISISYFKNQSGIIKNILAFLTDITDRKHMENIFKENEEKYRLLYSSMNEGVGLHEILLDEFGMPADYRFLDVNNSYEKLTGLNRNEIIGRTARQVLLIQDSFSIINYGEVALTGIPKHFENYSKEMGKYYEIFAYSPKKGLFATIINDITERKEAELYLQMNEERYRELFDGSSDGVIVYEAVNDGNDFLIIDLNLAVEEIEIVKKEDILGKSVLEIFPGIKSFGLFDVLKRVWKTGKPEHFPVSFYQDQRISGWRENYVYRLPSGEIVAIYEDATIRKTAEEQIKLSLKEKELLLKEVHHRVKNNLQIISSLLHLQEKYIRDKNDLEIFQDSQNRVKSMAMIHEKLYQSESFSKVDFKDYIQSLISNLYYSFGIKNERIQLETLIDEIYFNIDKAITCGLLLNELISNCFKHAFPDERKGKISLKIKKELHKYLLVVNDNGIGINENIDSNSTGSLGFQLINSLVAQLGGFMNYKSNKDGFSGTEFIISFPE